MGANGPAVTAKSTKAQFGVVSDYVAAEGSLLTA